MSYKILQLNSWSGKLATQIKRLRDEITPDIVCIQEDYRTIDRPGSIFESSDTMFPEETYPHMSFGKVQSFQFMHTLSDFGNTIKSKFPIVKDAVVYTNGDGPVENSEISKGSKMYNVRNFIHTEIRIGAKKVNVLTHQGYHDPKSKLGNETTQQQMKMIASYIDNLDGPVILTGDFNLSPDSPSLQPINSRLENLCNKYKIENTRTKVAKRKEVIDYIFVSKEINVVNFEASEMLVSDHKALILEFDL